MADGSAEIIEDGEEFKMPKVEHRIPDPPERCAGIWIQKWNRLFMPYPWVWCDEIAYAFAWAYIELLMIADRAFEDTHNSDLSYITEKGDVKGRPHAMQSRMITGSFISALGRFEERVIELAPRFHRGNDCQAWDHIPHVGKGKTVIDHQSNVGTNKKDGSHLLLGGRGIG